MVKINIHADKTPPCFTSSNNLNNLSTQFEYFTKFENFVLLNAHFRSLLILIIILLVEGAMQTDHHNELCQML